jgi:hypothetical protein
LVLNATSDSWTLNMTNHDSGVVWSVSATLTDTTGAGGPAMLSSSLIINPFPPGVGSATVSGVGPNPLQAGENYCVNIVGTPSGSTVSNGDWSWDSCFVEAH